MLIRARQFIREHHFSPTLRVIASGCEKFLRAFHNEGFYEFDANGEGRVLTRIASTMHAPVAFDVGAHTGDWTELLLAKSPDAQVHCFEIVPEICASLRDNLTRHSNIIVHPFGLSDRRGDVTIAYNKTHASTSAITPFENGRFFSGAETDMLTVQVETGDEVVDRLGLDRLDILKVDVEGHEVDVLKGFKRTLASNRAPRLIQFEYGQTYLPARHTLLEVYDLLVPCNYVIGRIFPNGVELKAYTPGDDHFRMGNYVAVKSSDPIRHDLVHQG